MKLYPALYHLNCDTCQRFAHDERTFVLLKNSRGEPIERPPGTRPPCRRHDGCPKGTPESQKTLSHRNQKAWEHYKKCKLTGRWPDDDLVLSRALLLDELIERCDDILRIREQSQMIELAAIKAQVPAKR